MTLDLTHQGPLAAPQSGLEETQPEPLEATRQAAEGRMRARFEESFDAAARRVPRYRIQGLLGTGGMGVVYRAKDTHLRRTIALKFLPPALVPNPLAKARFLDEARAASALDHPNICTIYEIGETAEGQLFLAMACYDGETLKQRLARGPLAAAEALHIALQVARGLAKAHRNGIVHRDIKPANLMITADGIVKILDFGIAQRPEGPSISPAFGTPDYMAPEQARGRKADARADVWSLGVVLHEMLTGRRPRRARQSGSGRLEEPAPIRHLQPDAPPEVELLLARMLASEPLDRYPDATELLPDLAAAERLTAARAGTTAGGHIRRRLPVMVVGLAAALELAASVPLLREGGWLGAGPPAPVPATLARLTDFPGREWFPSLSPDGSFFLHTRRVGDHNLLLLQRVGGANPMVLPLDSPQDDSQPAFSRDGRQIAFRSERDGGGIFVMGTTGEALRRVTDFGFNPSWSPFGDEILCASEGVAGPQARKQRSQVYRVSLASGARRLVYGGDGVQPSWSPHGFRIGFWGISEAGQRLIWTVASDGGQPAPVTDGHNVDWNPVWSPDGRYLYFASDRSGVMNLWRVRIDERSGRVLGKPEAVTASSRASMLPSFSRDGRSIAYASDDSRTVLEKVDFDPVSGTIASHASAITGTAQLILACDASRDGRSLVYQTSMPREDLVVVRRDGSGLRQLIDDGFRNRQPRWSPDGSRIAFYSNRGGSYRVWTIHPDGSALELAAAIPGRSAVHPVWSPDGQQLACDLEENEAMIDLRRPPAERRARLLPRPGPGLGFAVSSWSVDGKWLAGALHRPNEPHAPGIVLYSLAGRAFVRMTDRGSSPCWLSDSRRLLYWDGGKLFLLDTRSRRSQLVLTAPPGSVYEDFTVSPDDRTLYLARTTDEGEIWLLTLK